MSHKTYEALYHHFDGILKRDLQSCVIAIDGDAASGKTTLADDLGRRYHAIVIPMDHFYLPFDARSKEIAGHMDFKKVIESVLIPHQQEQPIRYDWYDPHIASIRETFDYRDQPILILEGSYSMHPMIRPYIQLSIYLKIDKKVQESRILNRSNPETLKRFKDLWIPKEKAYQNHFDIEHTADLVIDTSNV